MHLYLQLTRSLAVTLIWIYCNKLVLRYVRLRVSDPGQVSIPQPGIVTVEIVASLTNCRANSFIVKCIIFTCISRMSPFLKFL